MIVMAAVRMALLHPNLMRAFTNFTQTLVSGGIAGDACDGLGQRRRIAGRERVFQLAGQTLVVRL